MNCRIFLFFAVAMFITRVQAQLDITDQRPSEGLDKILITCQWANIVVRNSPGDQIKLKGVSTINKGENDEAFKFGWKQEGKTLLFNSDIENMEDLPRYISYKKNGQEFYQRIEKGGNVSWRKVREQNKNGGIVEMSNGILIDVNLVFYLPKDLTLVTDLKYGDIELENLTNSMDVNNTYGHVIATFEAGKFDQDCTISSTYSFVDVSLPSAARADLSLQTNYGEIYSDMNFTFEIEKCVDELYKNRIVGILNQGGKELILKSPYNNVYLRKKS